MIQDNRICHTSSKFHGVTKIQRWRSFLVASQGLQILCSWQHPITSQIGYKIGFEHQSLTHQWRLPLKTQGCNNESKVENPRPTKLSELTTQIPKSLNAILKESTMIQESNARLEVMVSNGSYSRSQTIIRNEFLRDDIKGGLVFNERTVMYMGALIIQKCMIMVIKMSLRYWLFGTLPLMKKHAE